MPPPSLRLSASEVRPPLMPNYADETLPPQAASGAEVRRAAYLPAVVDWKPQCRSGVPQGLINEEECWDAAENCRPPIQQRADDEEEWWDADEDFPVSILLKEKTKENEELKQQLLLKDKEIALMKAKAVGPRMANDYGVGFQFSRPVVAEDVRNRLKNLEEEDEAKALSDITNRNTAFNATARLECQFSKVVPLSENGDIVALLTKLDLSDVSKYMNIFREREIDRKLFLVMTEDDLKAVGVDTFDSRQKILRAISEIKERKKRIRVAYSETSV